MPKDAPYAPPIVSISEHAIGHLLAWELAEVTGTWSAWISWIRHSGGRPVHMVVQVEATSIAPLEAADKYEHVPKRLRGRDGLIRPWSGEIT